MKTLTLAAIRCPLIFTAVAALSIAYPASVQAVPTTYQYIGQHFTDVSGVYTTDDFVMAVVTLLEPLPPNFSGGPFATSFLLSDGVQSINNFVPDLSTLFQFATDSRGVITTWIVEVRTQTGQSILTHTAGPTQETDIGFLAPGNEGRNFGTVGVWTRVTATPDTGSTLSLMTLTLMALGLVARQFQRAAG